MGPALDLFVTPSTIECVLSFLALDATRSVRGIGEELENSGEGGPTADSLSTYGHFSKQQG